MGGTDKPRGLGSARLDTTDLGLPESASEIDLNFASDASAAATPAPGWTGKTFLRIGVLERRADDLEAMGKDDFADELRARAADLRRNVVRVLVDRLLLGGNADARPLARQSSPRGDG